MILAAKLLDPHIRAAGGRSAMLMVWPETSRFEFFDEVRVSYQLAAREVHGLFLPGTYLAALVVYEGITGNDARSLPAEAVVAGRTLSVPANRVRLLQQAGHEAVARFAGD